MIGTINDVGMLQCVPDSGLVLGFSSTSSIVREKYERGRKIEYKDSSPPNSDHARFKIHTSGPTLVLDNPMKRVRPRKKSTRLTPFWYCSSAASLEGARPHRLWNAIDTSSFSACVGSVLYSDGRTG